MQVHFSIRGVDISDDREAPLINLALHYRKDRTSAILTVYFGYEVRGKFSVKDICDFFGGSPKEVWALCFLNWENEIISCFGVWTDEIVIPFLNWVTTDPNFYYKEKTSLMERAELHYPSFHFSNKSFLSSNPGLSEGILMIYYDPLVIHTKQGNSGLCFIFKIKVYKDDGETIERRYPFPHVETWNGSNYWEAMVLIGQDFKETINKEKQYLNKSGYLKYCFDLMASIIRKYIVPF
jgi:hypothetical protein